MPSHPIKGKLKSQTDNELLSVFLKNNEMETLGELFGRYMHLVYGVCLKYLKDRENSKDAVVQIFEKICADIPKYQITNFKSWLYVVTKNFCLMELRKNNRQEKEISAVFMESEPEIHPIDRETEVNLNQALLDCIAKLKGGQEKCIRRFYFENRCYREIAAELGIEEKTVKSLIQNGKRNLKLCLERQQ